uniref:Uncharacterized protein n=1 Tax=Arundo donax TaxID=35708 RepID=A0A0A9FT46_ARUDO
MRKTVSKTRSSLCPTCCAFKICDIIKSSCTGCLIIQTGKKQYQILNLDSNLAPQNLPANCLEVTKSRKSPFCVVKEFTFGF